MRSRKNVEQRKVERSAKNIHPSGAMVRGQESVAKSPKLKGRSKRPEIVELSEGQGVAI
jgi:hypothetical protein